MKTEAHASLSQESEEKWRPVEVVAAGLLGLFAIGASVEVIDTIHDGLQALAGFAT